MFLRSAVLPISVQPPKMPLTSLPTAEPLLSIQDRIRTLTGVKIIGSGSATPERRVANEDLARLGCDPEWIVQRTGIHCRHHVRPGQSTSDLAIEAGRRCLANAGVAPAEVDLIVIGTMTPDHYTPGAAPLTQAALGCRCPAMDLNAACSGFMYALVTGGHFIKSNTCRNVLVIGADVMSMTVDPEDKKTYPLFGDGAGAVLLTQDSSESAEHSGMLVFCLASLGELSSALVIPAGGSRMPITVEAVEQRMQFLRMDGRAVFKWAVRLIPWLTHEMISAAHMDLSDIDLFVFHQANRRILDSAMKDLAIPHEKVFVNLDEYGNTSAASIPISLDECLRGGRIRPGNRVFLCGYGAGLSWGACIFQF